jgi:ring-1,2-phenylacetyl-CoA epoxidase subunit PaaC
MTSRLTSRTSDVADDEDATAYAALAAAVDDARWAFGTGFSDPLAGIDQTLPPDVDGPALADYCVMLADDALVLSHRLQQWVTRLPDLEEEAAVANIALDLLGQARRLYARAGQVGPERHAEDDYAFGREGQHWRCHRLVEIPVLDFAELVARLLAFSAARAPLMRRLSARGPDGELVGDPVLAAVAGQAVKELDYHLDWAGGWLVRLGDGTAESHRRMQAAVDALWPWVAELFDDHPVEPDLPTAAVPSSSVRADFDSTLAPLFAEATLTQPGEARIAFAGGHSGRDGGHTEHLSPLLAELQSVARAHPGATW